MKRLGWDDIGIITALALIGLALFEVAHPLGLLFAGLIVLALVGIFAYGQRMGAQ